MSALSIGVDVGGTFTDLVAVDASGDVTPHKVSALRATRARGSPPRSSMLDGADVARFVHGTTVATNMLLERAGARVALCATEGTPTCSQLAPTGSRLALRSLASPSARRSSRAIHMVGARERSCREGVLRADRRRRTRCRRDACARSNPTSSPIRLLHAYADGIARATARRRAARASCRALDVVLSSDVLPEIREYERTATTVGEAYVRPGVAHYLARLGDTPAASLGMPAPGVMTSSGGMRDACSEAATRRRLARALRTRRRRVGAAAALRAAGFTNALSDRHRRHERRRRTDPRRRAAGRAGGTRRRRPDRAPARARRDGVGGRRQHRAGSTTAARFASVRAAPAPFRVRWHSAAAGRSHRHRRARRRSATSAPTALSGGVSDRRRRRARARSRARRAARRLAGSRRAGDDRYRRCRDGAGAAARECRARRRSARLRAGAVRRWWTAARLWARRPAGHDDVSFRRMRAC